MPKYDVKKSFDGAISGCYVKRFEADTTVEINDPDLVAVALKEGWIESWVEPVAPEPDPEKAAPKNKAAKAAPKVKDTATE